ncbi:unnamed protein product [Linum trigynum]|uniref:Uncharacterized protein n=1 Tax=Linum trigynum TaxID=586398 RepID=A0AAV2GUF6_9ROSI
MGPPPLAGMFMHLRITVSRPALTPTLLPDSRIRLKPTRGPLYPSARVTRPTFHLKPTRGPLYPSARVSGPPSASIPTRGPLYPSVRVARPIIGHTHKYHCSIRSKSVQTIGAHRGA